MRQRAGRALLRQGLDVALAEIRRRPMQVDRKLVDDHIGLAAPQAARPIIR
jgi:hypothetical protein